MAINAFALPLNVTSQVRFADAPVSDTLHALILFARFRDDDSRGDPNVNFREWPDVPTSQLPAYAGTLLSASPIPPFPDSTLTAYFYQQSRGRLLVWGDVYPRVLISSQDEAAYHRPIGGYGELVLDLLGQIDEAGLDFSQYDANGDGIFDLLYIVLRTDSAREAGKERYTGISCLDARCGGNISASPKPLPSPVYDGVAIDWARSGSIIYNRVPGNIIPQLWITRTMAHELGHDLWAGFFNHIAPLADNPFPVHTGKQKHAVGYVLMAGAGGARDVGGSWTISAFERLLLGWIDCEPITDAEQVRLRDLYTTSDCRRINFTVNSRQRALLLSNLQRRAFFDSFRQGGLKERYELGLLRTTGLLVHLTDGRRLDVLPSDGDLTLSNDNQAYAGDLYGTDGIAQLTPWTRPTASGYLDDVNPGWFALDRIQTNHSDSSITFDYLPDFRLRPVIRADSWIDGPVELGPLSITGQATLVIRTKVTINGPVEIGPGSTLRIDKNGELIVRDGQAFTMRAGSKLFIDGGLSISGPTFSEPGSVVVLGAEGARLELRPD
ncbi:MAG: hypothetical protein KDD65_00245 [Bacteroidetes bacterium]|nr:hypothetical protein [Bacteroidota bacterium]